MLNYDTVFQFVLENFPGFKSRKKGNGTSFNFRCPFCGDSKKSLRKMRFHLQYDVSGKGYFHCWNCSITGNFFDLYAHVKGISSLEARKKLISYSSNWVIDSLKKKDRSLEKPKKDREDLSYFLKSFISLEDIPKSFKQEKLQEKLKEFCEKRKVKDLYACFEGKYSNRIIIPIWEEEKLVFFQGRRISSGQYPKYLNPEVPKEDIIFNRDNIDRELDVIVCEGLLDAKSIDKNGISCLGSSINDHFLSKIYRLTNKDIIICLDNDKPGIESIKKILKESKYKKRLKYFFFEDQNIGDINELYVKKDINNLYNYIFKRKVGFFEAIVKCNIEKEKLWE